ncbi:MAG: hypothetical protein KKD77_20565 [Gammaproteobacteria bacterium]|nr:hypothetical protein [Gammaproteobacteria bacterium]
MLNRLAADEIIRALTGGDSPKIGETIVFTEKGWEFSSVVGDSAVGIARASIYLTASEETVVSDSTNFFKVLGTTEAGELSGFSMPEDNSLVFDRTGPTTIAVVVLLTLDCSDSSQELHFRLGLNEEVTSDPSVASDTKVPFLTALSEQNAVLFWLGELEADDMLEVYVQDKTSTSNVSVTSMAIHAFGL